MGRKVAQKPLIEKLAAICRKIDYVPKRGKNPEYDYQKASDVAHAFRDELFRNKILIIADEQEVEQKIFTASTGLKAFMVRVKISFRVTDGRPDQDIIAVGFGVAADVGDKALYKAKTGALKYFLRGLGLVPDEADDPEYTAQPDDTDATETPQQKSRAQAYQRRAWDAALPSSGRTKKQIEAYLDGKFSVVDVTLLKRTEFDDAMCWLTGNEPMGKTLQMSVDVARKSNGGAA